MTTETLQHATVVRGDEGVDVFLDGGLDVAAGIRQRRLGQADATVAPPAPGGPR